ncbi:hypothetical protein PybrP1_010581 [[Pythium] brassicae (nom. inval.)]|nr:hypothetical protein PybrP1_010581 [[Pythium] brassicae (nom. inval.)]
MLLFAYLVAAVEMVAAASGGGSVITSTGRVRIAPSIAAVGAILVGAAVCFFGYRLLRPAIFVCGFLAGGLLVALIIEYAFAAMAWVALASWIGFLVAGAISGCVVLMMYHVGLFVIGALAGALLAFTLNTSFMYRLYPSQPDVMLVILIIRFRYRDGRGAWVYNIPTAWWLYLAALVLLFVIGVYWQFRRSAKNVRYTRENTTYQRTETPRAQCRSGRGDANRSRGSNSDVHHV